MAPFRMGFRVCDRRYPFLWSAPGQKAGRWNQTGDAPPVLYLASSPLVAWAEWLRGQDINDPEDLEGVAAALWAVVIPEAWTEAQLPEVELSNDVVMATDPQAIERRRQAMKTHKEKGAMGLRAPSAAMQDPSTHPCRRCSDGEEADDVLPETAAVLVLWCGAEQLAGWACVKEGRPSAEVLPFIRREGRMP